MKLIILAVSCAALCVLPRPVIGAKSLPPELKRCKENDDTTLGCIEDALQNAIPLFVAGVPALGVMSIDPLMVTEMAIVTGTNSPVGIHLTFHNESITGFGDMKIIKATGSTELDNYNLHVTVKIPSFKLIGDYKIDGKVMLLPITGSGFSNLTLVDMDVTVDILGKPIEKKGEKYLEVTDFMLNIEPKRLYMHFENLFNGDPSLANHMNNFLNENWSVIYKELKPSIEDTFNQILKEISNRIYSRVPYKNIVL